jgi:hypothetical protein
MVQSNIDRKIRTYRDYWSTHWQSLYDIQQEDTPENNMFFDKAWKNVTEEEIIEMSDQLSEEMGGWVFHQKVDFNNPTPHIKIHSEHPALMSDWIERNERKK